jgi:hypothetical protein
VLVSSTFGVRLKTADGNSSLSTHLNSLHTRHCRIGMCITAAISMYLRTVTHGGDRGRPNVGFPAMGKLGFGLH